MSERNAIAITIGDPAGIGPEITLKSFVDGRVWEGGVPVVCGDVPVLEAVKQHLEIPVDIVRVHTVEEAAQQRGKVPVLDAGVVTDVEDLKVGEVTALAGRAAVAYIQAAVDLASSSEVNGIATSPIHKEALRAAGFEYIGHTEMISEMSNRRKGITMFQVDKMRIFFHSRHVSLRKAIEMIRKDDLLESIEVAKACLHSVGDTEMKLAVAGLNPHSSDGGLFGNEENEQMMRTPRRT